MVWTSLASVTRSFQVPLKFGFVWLCTRDEIASVRIVIASIRFIGQSPFHSLLFCELSASHVDFYHKSVKAVRRNLAIFLHRRRRRFYAARRSEARASGLFLPSASSVTASTRKRRWIGGRRRRGSRTTALQRLRRPDLSARYFI